METPKDTVYLSSMPLDLDEKMLVEHFSSVGAIKTDKLSGEPYVMVYKDDLTHQPNGMATVTYEDPASAQAARDKLDCTNFRGVVIKVELERPGFRHSSGYGRGQGDRGGHDSGRGGYGGGPGNGRGGHYGPSEYSGGRGNTSDRW